MPAPASLACLALAGALAGCASTNPLMEEPASAEPRSGSAAPSGMQTSRPTGAKKFLGIFSPYRIDIQQGNFISEEMVARLKEGMQRPEGMTREQVRFVLGTPLLTDLFHADRWDYVFRLKKGDGEEISSRLTVFFENNRLARIEGGSLPAEKEYLDLIARRSGK